MKKKRVIKKLHEIMDVSTVTTIKCGKCQQWFDIFGESNWTGEEVKCRWCDAVRKVKAEE